MANRKLTQTPVHFSLFDDESQEFKFTMRPLTDEDINELDEWLRSEYIKTVRRSLRDTDDQTYMREIQLAHDAASSLTWMSGTGARKMATIEGMARLLWQGAKESTELTEKQVQQLMLSSRNILELNHQFETANGAGKPKGKKKSLPQAKRKKKHTK